MKVNQVLTLARNQELQPCKGYSLAKIKHLFRVIVIGNVNSG